MSGAAKSSQTAERHARSALYAMLFFMQCARSMFIVLISWFTLQTTGKTTAVGEVLICWQVVAFAVGLLMAPHLDLWPRRRVFAVGETTHALAMTLLGLAAQILVAERVPLLVLYACACMASLGSLLSYPTSQALIQHVGGRLLTRTVGLGILCAQLGNIAGAALAGLCLPVAGIAGGFLLCATSSLIAVLFSLILAVDDRGLARTRHSRHSSAILEGLALLVRNRKLSFAAFALVLAYASAHASNALLAGFARYDLKLPANLYGWLAAMYSGGGLLGSVALSGRFSKIEAKVFIPAGLILLSLATAMLSTAQSLASAMLWQGLIGLSFMMVRVAGDVMVLRSLPNRLVGRVRSNIEAGIGLVAIIVYLVASLSDMAPRRTFLALACLFALATCAILRMQRRRTACADLYGKLTPPRLARNEGCAALMPRLCPVLPSDRAVIKAVTLEPGQEQFAGSVDAVFDELQKSAFPGDEHPFAIVAAEDVTVGFFVLRERASLPGWAPAGVVTLHSLRIARMYQGQGYGRLSVELAIAWIRQNRPWIDRLMLAVNARNRQAMAAYLRCGFIDTRIKVAGPIGEQLVLEIAI